MITIVTINWNNRVGLQKTISSVLEKQFSSDVSFEHLIIDNCSKDGSLLDIRDYSKTNSNVIAIIEKDDGIYDAMNKGINYARGSHVLFLNSGDVLTSAITTKDIESNKCNTLGVAFGSKIEFSNQLKIKIHARRFNPLNPRMPTIHQSILYRTEILRNYPYSKNYKICGDFEQICRIHQNKNTFEVNEKIISTLAAGGVSTTRPFLLFKESASIASKICQLRGVYMISYQLRLLLSILIFQLLYRLSK